MRLCTTRDWQFKSSLVIDQLKRGRAASSLESYNIHLNKTIDTALSLEFCEASDQLIQFQCYQSCYQKRGCKNCGIYIVGIRLQVLGLRYYGDIASNDLLDNVFSMTNT